MFINLIRLILFVLTIGDTNLLRLNHCLLAVSSCVQSCDCTVYIILHFGQNIAGDRLKKLI